MLLLSGKNFFFYIDYYNSNIGKGEAVEEKKKEKRKINVNEEQM